MSRQFTITSRHLSVNGELVLKAMVSLIKINSGGNWVYSDDTTANLVIIDTDKEEGRRTWMEWSRQGTQQSLIAYTTKAERFPPGSLVLAKPLRSSDLIPLLAEAAGRIQGQPAVAEVPETAAAAKPAQPAPVAAAPAPIPTPMAAAVPASQQILDTLLRNSHSQPIRLADRQRVIVIERSRRLYYSSHPEDLATLVLATGGVEFDVLNPADLTTHIQGLSSHELDAPLWQAVLNSSSGRLLGGLSERDTFRLLRWPDFRKLDHKPMHVKLTVFLSKRGGDIPTLMQLSGLSGDKIIDFVNACHALHYLDVQRGLAAVAPTAVRNTDSGKLGLFAKIRARLGI